MISIMAHIETHPEQGEEVTAMDDVEVCVCSRSVRGISSLKGRMGDQ
jgi:hypothetical protein